MFDSAWYATFLAYARLEGPLGNKANASLYREARNQERSARAASLLHNADETNLSKLNGCYSFVRLGWDVSRHTASLSANVISPPTRQARQITLHFCFPFQEEIRRIVFTGYPAYTLPTQRVLAEALSPSDNSVRLSLATQHGPLGGVETGHRTALSQ